MSEAIQQADELRGKAISLLLTERTAIDDRLRLFGYDGTNPITQPTGRKKTCSVCNSETHTARTCEKKGAPESPLIQST